MLRGSSSYREPLDHEVAQTEWVALEVLEANLGAVSYHKVVLEEATPDDREQRQNQSREEPVVKRCQRKSQSQIAEKTHRVEELGRLRAEDLRESHSG